MDSPRTLFLVLGLLAVVAAMSHLPPSAASLRDPAQMDGSIEPSPATTRYNTHTSNVRHSFERDEYGSPRRRQKRFLFLVPISAGAAAAKLVPSFAAVYGVNCFFNRC
ncbi:hypothetical protein GCK32_002214 [Trichostrongylus colubriformis]|uniref:Secreted protein n=1 Tax=Trichostrongylus colubriformis TaxID=6319 RepID=A0AAN8G0G8_TRICO